MADIKNISELIQRIIGGTEYLFRHLLSGFVFVGVLWVLHPHPIETLYGPEGAGSKWILPILSLVLGFVLYALNSVTYHPLFYGRELRFALRRLVKNDKSFREKLEKTLIFRPDNGDNREGWSQRRRERADRKSLREQAYQMYFLSWQLDLARWRRRQGTTEEQAIQRGLDDWNSITHFLLTSALALVFGSLVAWARMDICKASDCKMPECYLVGVAIGLGVLLYALACVNGIRATMREIMMFSRSMPPKH